MKIRGNELAFALLCLSIIAFIYINQFDVSPYYDGDSITHYQFSHYAPKHPKLYFDIWAKPLFTLLSSPFSHFGMTGMVVFNIMCAAAAAFLSFKVAERLKIPNAELCVVFTLFAPVYFVNIGTGLTEILFSLVLTGSIYLFLRERFLWSALLVSLLPFCRSEGYLILPLFLLALLLARQYKAIPLLAAGWLILTLAGMHNANNDFLWVFHQNPYHTTDLYGKGPLLHFVAGTKTIGGLPLTIAFAAGLIPLGIHLSKSQKHKSLLSINNIGLVVLVLGSFLVYFCAHSYFRWKGIFGSAGLHRVMAAVMPVLVIISLMGINYVLGLFKILGPMTRYLFVALVLAIAYTPISAYQLPRSLHSDELLIKQTADWLKSSKLELRHIYITHPLTAEELNTDPFDPSIIQQIWQIHDDPDIAVPKGSVVVWDNLFGQAETNQRVMRKIRTSSHFRQVYIAHSVEGNNDTPDGGGPHVEVYVKQD